MIEGLHPSLILIVGGALLMAIRGSARAWLTVALPVISYVHFMGLEVGMNSHEMMAGISLHVLHVDKMALLFGTLFHVAALIAGIYAMHVKDRVQHSTGMMYAGSAVGAVLAGDFMTLFIFWELLAVTSVFQIWARKTPRARGAGMRYLLMHVLSGLFLLAGTLWLYLESGDTSLRQLDLLSLGVNFQGLAPWLLLIAFGIKACFPFAHTWLVDAYPEATPTGTVFLSAFTTKTAVYVLARTFAGEELLVWIGATMAMFPIYYAVVENDLRRVLGYSMINQIGFMVVGIGIGTELAINGAVAHAFNDVIFKGLLFMTMGAVIHRVGHCYGSDLGHLRKSMPFTSICCIVGAASISAFPLFSGFISKSMVMSGAAYAGYPVVWLILLFASAGVFHHAGIKIPFFAFYGHDHGIRVEKPPLNMRVAMGLGAVACIVLGSYPPLLYNMLPFPVEYVPYDLTHVSTQIQILCWSALAFCVLMVTKVYPPELHSTNLDTDWFWRKPLKGLVQWIAWVCGSANRWFRASVGAFLQRCGAWVKQHHSPGGVMGEPWPTGSTALWAAILLGLFLLMSL